MGRSWWSATTPSTATPGRRSTAKPGTGTRCARPTPTPRGGIRRHFGIDYHPEHVRKVLKRRLKWTSQKPQKKAKERDEEVIAA
jgi:Winged helix-turn helix